jgi:hypothetical protein
MKYGYAGLIVLTLVPSFLCTASDTHNLVAKSVDKIIVPLQSISPRKVNRLTKLASVRAVKTGVVGLLASGFAISFTSWNSVGNDLAFDGVQASIKLVATGMVAEASRRVIRLTVRI